MRKIDSVNSLTVLSKSECEHVIAKASKQEFGRPIAHSNKDGEPASDIRSVFATDYDDDAMRQFVFAQFKKLNHLKLDISALEPIQVFRYEAGDGYGWHTDWSPNNNKKRKLSITIQLSSPTDYEGGQVEIMDGPEARLLPSDQGSATVFPSWALHRVKPVVSGSRWAMVAWAVGPQFR